MSIKHKKRKGKRFEEQVAELIRKYWKLKDKEVYRSLTSGNYRGVEFGDITWSIPIEKFKYIPLIECKNQETWNLEQLITSSQYVSFFDSKLINRVKQPFKKWFQQINKEYKTLQEIYFSQYSLQVKPLLLFKKRYSPVYCLCEFDTELLINEDNLKLLNYVVYIVNVDNTKYILADFENLLRFDVLKKPFD
jgi:hypothetical protein